MATRFLAHLSSAPCLRGAGERRHQFWGRLPFCDVLGKGVRCCRRRGWVRPAKVLAGPRMSKTRSKSMCRSLALRLKGRRAAAARKKTDGRVAYMLVAPASIGDGIDCTRRTPEKAKRGLRPPGDGRMMVCRARKWPGRVVRHSTTWPYVPGAPRGDFDRGEADGATGWEPTDGRCLATFKERERASLELATSSVAPNAQTTGRTASKSVGTGKRLLVSGRARNFVEGPRRRPPQGFVSEYNGAGP